MKFSLKIFISFFATTLILGSGLIWIAYSHVSKQTKEEFISRYQVFSKVMGDTLTRLDTSTEALMLNAAKVVSAKDSVDGLLSTESLKSMRDELSVTHIFIIDKKGNFVRSTNEDPKLIPNAYSFCPKYKDMIVSTANVDATPIVHPNPEPKPYKFLFIPNSNRERLLEIGVRVDFVAKTLTEALGSDTNIMSMSLYSPQGKIFGRFDSKAVDFKGATVEVPSEFPNVVESENAFHFFTKVASSHPQCCQCDVSGTSKNGEYYYVLESEVSKKELAEMLASTKNIFMTLAFANLLLAFLFSRFLSRRLVKNIETAASKIRSLKKTGDLKSRLNCTGKDEVAYLTHEFDRLLDSLEDSQNKVIEAEKVQAKVQLAKEVAHNIRSPVVAIEMMLPSLSQMPAKLQKVFRDSAREIKALSERLSKQADGLNNSRKEEVFHLPTAIEDIVQKKKIEYSNIAGTSIEFSRTLSAPDAFVLADPTELSVVVSNLINNAIESYSENSGYVQVICESNATECRVLIVDSGKGIPAEFIDQLGTKNITYGKECGRGIGLQHAYSAVKSWQGNIEIRSIPGVGTTVALIFRKLPQEPQIHRSLDNDARI